MFGAAAIALMNSDRHGDLLADGRWLATMLPEWGVAEPGPIGGDELDEFRRLRALLRRLTEALGRGGLSAADIAAFNEVISSTPVRVRLVPDGRRYVLDMTPLAEGWCEYAVREVAGSFGAMLRADPTRLKICAGPGCGTVFRDETRSRTRTWCDSRSCGNRARVRRHRAGLRS